LPFPEAQECSAEFPDCKKGTKIFQATRVVSFLARDLNSSAIRSQLRSVEGGECAFTRINNYAFSATRNQLNYSFSPMHQDRACNFGIVIDKSRSSADVTITATLNEDFSIKSVPNVRNQRSNFGGIFGDLVNTLLDSPLAKLAKQVGIPNLVNVVLNQGNFGGNPRDFSFAKSGIDLNAYSNVQQRLDRLGTVVAATPYKTDRAASGFGTRGDDTVVEVFQRAYALELTRPHFIDVRKIEIEFLSSLSEVDPKQYVVKPGDNLWSLVRDEYLDARLHLLVGQMNGLDRTGTLKVGRTLQLPRWHELCRRLGGTPEAVQKGESLWLKASKGQIPRDVRSIRTYSGNSSLIYPLEVLHVRAKSKE
jgi:hypothetical protein